MFRVSFKSLKSLSNDAELVHEAYENEFKAEFSVLFHGLASKTEGAWDRFRGGISLLHTVRDEALKIVEETK
jgi:hypothetical protein